MAAKLALLALLITSPALGVERSKLSLSANPIRKVVTMLQMMTKKVEAEGEKEKELFEKFMCYCKNSGTDLAASIDAAGKKIPEVSADIQEGQSQADQLKMELQEAQNDRSAAKKAMADATALRDKEAGAFAAEKAESETNIAAMSKAVTALEKGMGAAFLQSAAAQTLQKVLLSLPESADADRQEVLSFLSGKEENGYAPQSGEIVGILKQMLDTMSKALADSTADEEAAIKSYDELMSAKTKEVNALSAAIEKKTTRSGELAVDIVQMKEDLEDTKESLAEDQKFQADLQKNCKTKQAAWDEICKTRSEELVALADTIKILNDDDALELFKKTLPGSSFLQIKETAKQMRARALAFVTRAQKMAKNPQLNLLALALKGKKAGFGKVLKMLEDMVALLRKEQTDDDDKKQYCITQFDTLDDQKKANERAIADSEASIADGEEAVAQLKSDIKALTQGIKELDKSVAEATVNRKDEHASFTQLMAEDSAGREVLGFAKNRLNKFYNPKMYKAPPKRVLSEEDRITVNMGGTLAPTAPPGGIAGTGVTVFAQIKAHDAPPPPEAPTEYNSKSQESNGVIAMIDRLIADLDKEMQEAKTAEKDAQVDYEADMKDAAEKRQLDSKTLTDKEAAKAAAEANLQAAKEKKTSQSKQLLATVEVIQSLHGECDWLLKNFNARKEARAGEVDSLNNAKAVLSGADFDS